MTQVGEIFKVPSAWSSVIVDGYVDPSGGNRYAQFLQGGGGDIEL